jgi:hypothetical protein
MRTFEIILNVLCVFAAIALTVIVIWFFAMELYCINNNLVALLNYNWVYYENEKYIVRDFTGFSYNDWDND